jgi:hypothetical protein
MRTLNLGLRFFLELALLAAVGYWGFQAGQTVPNRLLAGIGVPLLVAVLWGMFISPKARISLNRPARLSLELLLFGAGALALAAANRPGLAAGFAAVALVSSTIHFFTTSPE